MTLPNADRAVVDIGKLRGYCLNPNHPVGKHKARMFETALGLTNADAEELQIALLAAARNDETVLGEVDAYGQRYVLRFTLSRAGQTANILSAWIVRIDEDFPRLTTCYID